EQGDEVFSDRPKYYVQCLRSPATCIILNKRVDVPPRKTVLVCDQPFEAYVKIVDHLMSFNPSADMRSGSAVVGKGTFLYPNVYLGNNVRIGRNCIVHPNVTILDHCEIGDNVIIQAGTVIGSDAFYYNSKKDRECWYKKMTSC